MASNPNETLRLSNGKYSIPMWIENGIEGIRLNSITPGSFWAAGGGPGRYGDAEPIFAFNEQRTWEGGRALADFVDDVTRFYDSKGAWTLTPNHLLPAPQWKFGRNYRKAINFMPGDMGWVPLYDNARFVTRTITPSANIDASKVYFWVKFVGQANPNHPSTLNFELCADDGSGLPGSVLASDSVSTNEIHDVLSVLQAFSFSAETLSASTPYHLKVYGEETDNRDVHWELGVDEANAAGFMSSDDTDWTATTYSAYVRITEADQKAWSMPFVMGQMQYEVVCYADGSASKLFLNGKRGKATAGSSSALTDTNNSFGSDGRYVGALVKIIAGTGFGQVRKIVSHTDTALTVTGWDITPDNTSEYIVYQTPEWTEVTGTGLGRVQSVAVYNNIAHFGHMGSGDPIRQIRFNPGASPPAHEFRDDGSNEANILAKSYVAGTGVVLWRAVGATVSRANAQSWGNNHSFGTGIVAGDAGWPVTNMLERTGDGRSQLSVLKANELGYVDDDKYYKINVRLDSFPEPTNGMAALEHGLYLYFNWTWSLQRLYGTNLDDLDPNKEEGFPPERQGYISAMAYHPVGPIYAIDAGEAGYSSVLFWDGNNHHEIFRAWEQGKRIRSLTWQANEGGHKYLWIGVGDDLVYLAFPQNHRNPEKDPEQEFMHEYSLVGATHDLGNLSIYKVWKDITLISRNLGRNGAKVMLDYQTDADIGSTTWTELEAGVFRDSPSSQLELMVGGSRQIRFRIRAQSNRAKVPVMIKGVVLKGVGQTPTKLTASFWATFGPVANQVGGSSEDLLEVLRRSSTGIWTVEDCVLETLRGQRVLVGVVSVDPAYSLNKRNEVRAQLTLMSLED